jgi:hypothetical protein
MQTAVRKKQAAYKLIDAIPDEKMDSLITVLCGFKEMSIPVTEADAWDLRMLREIEDEKGDVSVSFEESLEKAGFTFDDLQNPN